MVLLEVLPVLSPWWVVGPDGLVGLGAGGVGGFQFGVELQDGVAGLVESFAEAGEFGSVERPGDLGHRFELGEPDDGIDVGGVGE